MNRPALTLLFVGILTALALFLASDYQSRDGKTVIVAIRSKVLGSDFNTGTEAIRRVREDVDRIRPASFDPGITYGFAGDLQTGISEYTSINEDLSDVGDTGALLIAGVMFLYYLRVRTLITMLSPWASASPGPSG